MDDGTEMYMCIWCNPSPGVSQGKKIAEETQLVILKYYLGVLTIIIILSRIGNFELTNYLFIQQTTEYN